MAARAEARKLQAMPHEMRKMILEKRLQKWIFRHKRLKELRFKGNHQRKVGRQVKTMLTEKRGSRVKPSKRPICEGRECNIEGDRYIWAVVGKGEAEKVKEKGRNTIGIDKALHRKRRRKKWQGLR